MKFKLFFRFMSVAMLIQSAAFAAYSATTPAFRSFGTRFQAPVTSKSSLNEGSTWSGRLDRMMNSSNDPYKNLKTPQATLQKEALNSVVAAPQEAYVAPMVSMNSFAMPYVSNDFMYQSAPVVDFAQQLFAELNTLDAVYEGLDTLESELYHAKRRNFLHFKLAELRALSDQMDEKDFKGQNSVATMQNFLNAALEHENFMLRNIPAMKKRAENRKRAEQARRTYELNREAQELDEELSSGMPVENPYGKVKQDVKNQFTRGAKIGAAGAGTLYGLKKHQEMNV